MAGLLLNWKVFGKSQVPLWLRVTSFFPPLPNRSAPDAQRPRGQELSEFWIRFGPSLLFFFLFFFFFFFFYARLREDTELHERMNSRQKTDRDIEQRMDSESSISAWVGCWVSESQTLTRALFLLLLLFSFYAAAF